MKPVFAVHLLHLKQPLPLADSGPPINILWLLLVFLVCAVVSFLLCRLAMIVFPKFRSGEHKPGTHRPDFPNGRREIKTMELPLVGGPAFIVAILCVGIGTGYLIHFNQEQWTLLWLSLGATFGYAVVGFCDDWCKVYRNEGIPELAKLTGVFLVGAVVAISYFFLLPAGQQPYGIWKDLPILNSFLCVHPIALNPEACSTTGSPIAYYGWLIFLVLLIGAVGSATSICVDFSDGLDGLAGGLVFSASLAMGIVVMGFIGKQSSGVVLEVLALLGAGGVLGYLPLNWPSAWTVRARKGHGKRRARIIMGDCGALGMGGLLAMTAIFSRNETLLFMIGGAFVLEGASAFISARVLTRFFRRHLQILRFANSREFVPHTEFPLPFLATPLHHHFDLLGWDRRRLVYGAWALGACFAALGVWVDLNDIGWQRYVGRFLCLILALAVWSSGSWSKCYFVGAHPAARTRRRRLALYYGYPFVIMGIRMFHMVEVIEASEDVIETPAEELALWQRMTIFDARSMLGLYCYRAGYYPAAMAQWMSIPERNRILRPEIVRLLAEVDTRLALEKQETQPMRRDQILPPEPIIEGNLPPADLPNPYEPVQHDETESESIGGRNGRKPPAYPNDNDNAGNKQTATTGRGERTTRQNPQEPNNASEHAQPPVTMATMQTPVKTESEQAHWLARLLGLADPK